MKFIISLLHFKNEVVEKRITVYAAQSGFFLLMSVIPFIMVFLNVIQFVSIDALNIFFTFLDTFTATSAISDVIIAAVHELYNQSSEALISISLLSAIWSSSKGVYAIETGLNQIYGTQKQSFIRARIISFFYMIVLLILILVSVVVLMFGRSIYGIAVTWLSSFPPLAPFLYVIQLILQFRIVTVGPLLLLFIMCLYTFYPGRKLRFCDQFWGALFSTAGWIIFSFCYEFYIRHISNYSTIYGSLGAVLLLLLWIYFCLCIVLFGAEINHFLSKVRKKQVF